MLEGIRAINHGFPLAKVVAVDLPSGMPSDSGEPAGEFARADYTVTFTAPKVAHAHAAELRRDRRAGRGRDRQPARRCTTDVWLSLVEPAMFAELLAPRPPIGHKGTFGHVLVIGGSRGQDRRGGDGRDGGVAGRGAGW